MTHRFSSRRLYRLLPALAACVSLAAAAAPSFVAGPYKHVPMAFDAATQLMGTAIGGKPAPLAGVLPAGAGTVSWAFATGECGRERWGRDIATDRFARANVEAFERADLGFIVSTGGQGQMFSCASDDGMERFIARYASPKLVGFDFDIEAGQSDKAIASLVRAARHAQDRHPGLRMSFTLPTFAAQDGSGRSLNRIGQRVMKALRAERFDTAVINLMVMDYGDARPDRCVLKKAPDGTPLCDMGGSAAQAARNLHAGFGVPLDHVELTAMIGVNDVVLNVFSMADAQRMIEDARQLGLAGLHIWSLDRDTPCAAPAPGASDSCSGVAQSPLAFTEAIVQAAKASPK